MEDPVKKEKMEVEDLIEETFNWIFPEVSCLWDQSMPVCFDPILEKPH